MRESAFPPAVGREQELDDRLQPVKIAVHTAKLSIAGTVAGLVECIASYPLDTIKTRIQMRGGSAGALSSFATVIREDGVLALYSINAHKVLNDGVAVDGSLLKQGMSSRLVASMMAASVLFGTNGALKDLLRADSKKPLSVPFILAASGTGVIESLVFCPLELVKTRMQVLRGSNNRLTTWSVGVDIYRRQGIVKGLYRGISSLALREGVGNLGYFTSYEVLKQMIAEKTSGSEAGVVTIATAGGLAGMIYGLVAHPIDTVKTLVQTDSLSAPKYQGFMDGLRQGVVQGGGGARGFAGLYRGLSPSVARAFVGNAILFLTLETIMDVLGR